MTHPCDITRLTTFGVPAHCAALHSWDSQQQLSQLYAEGIFRDKYLCLGGGSNLLFTTGYFPGAVVHCTDRTISISEGENPVMRVGTGASLADAVAAANERALWGLENLAGIPGSVGGAIVQNAGAYGDETGRNLIEVKVFNPADGTVATLKRHECHFGYRTSVFKSQAQARGFIIMEASFRLSTVPSPMLGYAALAQRFGSVDVASLTPDMLCREVVALRNSKLPDPRHIGSAGSFFKNPVIDADDHKWLQRLAGMEIPAHRADEGKVKLSAAWLIDQSGGKNLACGGASVWQKQPVVLVNSTGTATGADIVELEHMIQGAVARKFNIMLQPEVIHI